MRSSSLRDLPSVDDVLKSEGGIAATAAHGHPAAVAAARHGLAQARRRVVSGDSVPDATAIGAAVLARLDREARPNIRAVFNLTGTVLHTNLGRALLAEAAIEAATLAMRGAIALEFDLDTGRRGERDELVRGLLCELSGAEDATLVNNNAAALMIVLNTLALDREAIVSRGELIEIGGAFRLPDIMARSGTRLVEIGTTNRTHPRDYEAAIGGESGLILRVHTSNYLIQGFTASVGAPRLAAIARKGGLPFVNDLGSGTLVDLRRFGLAHEPTVAEAVADGADLVTFSGDKLLGGPQAGFIVGRRDLVARINANPMKRAMRVDKIRLAAIEATLRIYRNPDVLAQRLPTMHHMTRLASELAEMAERLRPALQEALGDGLAVTVASCASQIGSGSLPLATIPSAALRIARGGARPPAPPKEGVSPTSKPRRGSLESLAAAFRALPIPVIGRIEDDALWFDLRCLEDEQGFVTNLAGLGWSEAA